MTFDLYVWRAPRVTDSEAAEALVRTWEDEGGRAEGRPFEASNDVHWFYNELIKDLPALDSNIDEAHEHGTERWWWAPDPGPKDRLVRISFGPNAPPDALDEIFSIAAKYDLVVYDPRTPRVHFPLEELTEFASATFWPRGAIQAFVAGALGGAGAVAAWIVSIPIVSGLVVLVGGFMSVMAVYTFVHEGRKAMARRQQG